jgi:hypothetical protein
MFLINNGIYELFTYSLSWLLTKDKAQVSHHLLCVNLTDFKHIFIKPLKFELKVSRAERQV